MSILCFASNRPSETTFSSHTRKFFYTQRVVSFLLHATAFVYDHSPCKCISFRSRVWCRRSSTDLSVLFAPGVDSVRVHGILYSDKRPWPFHLICTSHCSSVCQVLLMQHFSLSDVAKGNTARAQIAEPDDDRTILVCSLSLSIYAVCPSHFLALAST